ncbi:MAG: stage V sporulation protein AD [Dethiobacter sp.]|nr:stage V sporulation protein AD [Dethiobacter sp.]
MKKKGQTLFFETPPRVRGAAAVVGPKEGLGPFGADFDLVYKDVRAGENSFERGERRMFLEAAKLAMDKAGVSDLKVDFLLAGDLLNQIISSGFVARELNIPYLGLYGACSTFGEAVVLGSVLVDGGFARTVLGVTGSHNCGAERQYRYPTEYGVQRPGTAQWTATGAGAVVLGLEGEIMVRAVTVGKVHDLGVKDPFNMGTAMAPAAADTIFQHFQDTGRDVSEVDLIATGDLGMVGKEVNVSLLERQGLDIAGRYLDCGVMLYYSHQKVDAGGSGCGCAAVVTIAHLFKRLREGDLRRILVVPTGALHSPTSYLQGDSIPCIAHAVLFEAV